MSDSLWSHGPQHARLPCPTLSPRVCSNSCPLSWWYYLTISSSATLFSFCLQFFPASGSFPMSWLFPSQSQSIRVSTSISVLPMNVQGWFPLECLVWAPCNPWDSQESSPAPQFENINSLSLSLLMVQLSHPYMTTCKTIALTIRTSVGKVTSLFFNMLSKCILTNSVF